MKRVHLDVEANPVVWPTLEDVEFAYIKQVLVAVRGNKTVAAGVLGIDRRTLYRKLDRGLSKTTVRLDPHEVEERLERAGHRNQVSL